MTGAGHLFVHYGEEHWNDDDGLTLLPKIVEESRRYKPALVTMSGDKDNDGTVDQLTMWRRSWTPTTARACPTSPAWATTTAIAARGAAGTAGCSTRHPGLDRQLQERVRRAALPFR